MFGQDEILNPENVFPFVIKLDSLNDVFTELKKKEYYSVQQTNADYVRIITKDPEGFIHDLNAGLKPKEILNKYDNSIIDKNVFITKTKYNNYNNDTVILFQSYEIENNNGHKVEIPYDEKIFNELRLNGKYFYKSYYDKSDKTTSIEAFYILSDFNLTKLDTKLTSYLDYSDLIIGKENIFKYEEYIIIPDSIYNPVDSLTKYFNLSTGKPIIKKEESYPLFLERFQLWNKQKEGISDSLFLNSIQYRKLLIQSVEFAKQTRFSNALLEDLVDRYISKQESLNLMRLSSKRGEQSFDATPVNQHVRICKKAAEISNWDVFIKSLINIMNDNMNRIVDNSLVRTKRKTYLNEIEKLPIDLSKLLIGMSLKTSTANKFHFWGSGDRIGAAIANSNKPEILIDATCVQNKKK
jgi:hypothetical protein